MAPGPELQYNDRVEEPDPARWCLDMARIIGNARVPDLYDMRKSLAEKGLRNVDGPLE